jgi:hypothetical protein
MQNNTPSSRTNELYRSLQEQFEGVVVFPDEETKHSFNIKLQEFENVPDEVQMDGDGFPYFRSALVTEAIARGDIR